MNASPNLKLRDIVGRYMTSVFIDRPWVTGIGVGWDGNEDCISINITDKTKSLEECVPSEWLQFKVYINYESSRDADVKQTEIEEILF
jgi:hypothetical protein